MVRVAVIGAGVIGLSSGLRILERFPQAEVIVMADTFPPNTTSDVAGGFWEPHLLGNTPEHKIREWSGKTLEHMKQLAGTDSAKYTGACLLSGFMCDDKPDVQPPFWKDLVQNFRELTKEELSQFPDMKTGFFYTTAILEPRLYLQWLMKRFQRRGGRLKKRYIKSFSDLADESFDVVVNCTGVGARDLVGDTEVTPVRGQVIRGIAPWVKHFYIFQHKEDAAYMLPSTNFLVIGGTHQTGNWDKNVSQADKISIWDRCLKYLPSLSEATIDSDHVGLRPYRTEVRLELQHLDIGGKLVPVVHNYGHGGSGVTLHWGCAEHATNLVQQALGKEIPRQAKL